MRIDLKIEHSRIDKDGVIELACEVVAPEIALQINDFLVLKSRWSHSKETRRQRAITKIGVILLAVSSDEDDQKDVATLAFRPLVISTNGPPCRSWFGVIYLALRQSTYSAIHNRFAEETVSKLLIWIDASQIRRLRTMEGLAEYALRPPWCDETSRGTDVRIQKFRFSH